MYNMRNCYLSRNYKNMRSAGSKAKTDMERIWAEEGFVNLGLTQTRSDNKVYSFFRTLASVCTLCFRIRRGDVLFLQYPFKKYFAFVCNVAHRRGARVVTLIHDLGSFRRKKLTVPQEIARLSHDHAQRPDGSLASRQGLPAPHDEPRHLGLPLRRPPGPT